MVGRLPRLTRRPFADLAVWMAAFGLAVGLVFPAFSVSLGVPPAVAFRPLFQLGCLGAGLLVGLCNFALARSVVGTRLRRLAAGMSAVRVSLATAMDSGEVADCGPLGCKLPVDSADELGTVAAAFNALIDAVARAQTVERALTAASTAVARQVEADQLAEAALDPILAATGARGGAVLRGRPGAFTMLARRHLPADLTADVLDPLATTSEATRGACGAGSTRPLTVTPLRVGDRPVGALVLDLSAAAPPGLKRLLAVLGDTLAVALTNAELHARTRHQAAWMTSPGCLTGAPAWPGLPPNSPAPLSTARRSGG
jgi:hypothetical protein